MEFLISFVDKILWTGFAFSILSILYYMAMFLIKFFKTPPQQLVLTRNEKIAIGVYLAYIIMCIFTGIRL